MGESVFSRRALIVDDEFLIAFDLERLMRELGFGVCIARCAFAERVSAREARRINL
jgi:hypothetical protein